MLRANEMFRQTISYLSKIYLLDGFFFDWTFRSLQAIYFCHWSFRCRLHGKAFWIPFCNLQGTRMVLLSGSWPYKIEILSKVHLEYITSKVSILFLLSLILHPKVPCMISLYVELRSQMEIQPTLCLEKHLKPANYDSLCDKFSITNQCTILQTLQWVQSPLLPLSPLSERNGMAHSYAAEYLPISRLLPDPKRRQSKAFKFTRMGQFFLTCPHNTMCLT